MKSEYMRYETGVKKAELRPLSVQRSNNITKMSTGQILAHLYKRHEITALYVMVSAIFTYVVVAKLG